MRERRALRQGRRPSILLVEDDETDILQFLRLSKKHSIERLVHIVEDGDAALDYLRKQDNKNGVSPVVVVTDLNMPGMTGHELIEDIRGDAKIANTAILVLSTSDLESDIARAYANHVAGYIVKDTGGEAFASCVQLLRHYCDIVTSYSN